MWTRAAELPLIVWIVRAISPSSARTRVTSCMKDCQAQRADIVEKARSRHWWNWQTAFGQEQPRLAGHADRHHQRCLVSPVWNSIPASASATLIG